VTQDAAPAPGDVRVAPDTDALRAIRDAAAAALRDPDAARLGATLAAIDPAHARSGPAQALRAEQLRRRGQSAAAIPLYADAIALCPELLAAYHGAALAHVAERNLGGARALWEALLERDPADASARYQIALAWHDEGNLAEAARWYERQLELAPESYRAAFNLGIARLDSGDAPAAVAALSRAAQIDGRLAKTFMALGTAQRRAGDGTAAARSFLRAQELEPATIDGYAAAISSLTEAAELPAALDVLARAIPRAPRDPSLQLARGAILSSLALHADALAAFRDAHAIDPADVQGHSALLLEMQYDTAAGTREALSRAHWDWAEAHARGLRKVTPVARAEGGGDARLRIGYLSPRFCRGPLANLFLPVLEAHDRTRFHVTLYSAYAQADDVTARMQAAADAWRELPADDNAAAAMIAADDLDLLIDLAGHSPHHRLAVLARKPAQVQATWLDYFDTSGVPEIDYVLTDTIHTPESERAHFRERIVWLPNSRFVYQPAVAPTLTDAPSRRTGRVTFGSFNRHAKITDEVLRTWKAVLDAVPGARLSLRASAYRGPGTVAWLRDRWRNAGMPIDRIDFLPFVPIEEAIASYRDIDVALDTFPYNGGATTCDALSMGVPVIALNGDRMIARQSAALLHAAGRDEWVTATPEAYIACAADVAQRVAAGEIREELFRGFPGTALCRVKDFVPALERAYATMIATGPRAGDGLAPIAIDA
jgi:predicted O-linked N-acetylglucosamine transferase (SPINDLY family)